MAEATAPIQATLVTTTGVPLGTALGAPLTLAGRPPRRSPVLPATGVHSCPWPAAWSGLAAAQFHYLTRYIILLIDFLHLMSMNCTQLLKLLHLMSKLLYFFRNAGSYQTP